MCKFVVLELTLIYLDVVVDITNSFNLNKQQININKKFHIYTDTEVMVPI